MQVRQQGAQQRQLVAPAREGVLGCVEAWGFKFRKVRQQGVQQRQLVAPARGVCGIWSNER